MTIQVAKYDCFLQRKIVPHNVCSVFSFINFMCNSLPYMIEAFLLL
jgi:hypothetical protein